MSSPSRGSMEAYLKQMGVQIIPDSFRELQSEYLRQIYRILPRDKALAMPLKKAQAKTAITTRPPRLS